MNSRPLGGSLLTAGAGEPLFPLDTPKDLGTQHRSAGEIPLRNDNETTTGRARAGAASGRLALLASWRRPGPWAPPTYERIPPGTPIDLTPLPSQIVAPSDRRCVGCNEELPRQVGSGRPRKTCDRCATPRQRWHRKAHTRAAGGAR